MSRFTLGFFTGTVMTASALVVGAGLARASDLDIRVPQLNRTEGRVKVYLHRDGGRVLAGRDDPGTHRSGVLARHGLSHVDIPAFRGGTMKWNAFVGCVEKQFTDFDLEIVTERPTSGDYIMSMVGGAPSQFGFDKTVGGIAPYGGTVLRDAFVFVFETPHGSTQTLCETAAHEIGHALGLDHTRLCNDVMSYERCGNKEFHDQRVACGEWNDRRCSDGSNSQSSWGKLAQLVGVRNESEAPSVSEPRPPASTTATRPKAPAPVASTDPRRQPTHGSGRSGRSLRVRPATSVAPGSLYVVEVDARDSDGIRDVDLVWYDSRARRLRCSDAKVSDAFLCYRRGNTYTFVLRVGQGTRRFYASVTDGKGTTARSKTYTVRFQ